MQKDGAIRRSLLTVVSGIIIERLATIPFHLRTYGFYSGLLYQLYAGAILFLAGYTLRDISRHAHLKDGLFVLYLWSGRLLMFVGIFVFANTYSYWFLKEILWPFSALGTVMTVGGALSLGYYLTDFKSDALVQ